MEHIKDNQENGNMIFKDTHHGEVAILLCCYNGERYIRAQLDSLVKQTYRPYTCYIHDGGSVDRTLEIIEEYITKYPRLFVKIQYENKSKGACANFMSLLQYARKHLNERYFMLCDQDDVWFPEKIKKSVQSILRREIDGKPIMVYCEQIITDEHLKVLNKEKFLMKRKRAVDDTFKRIVFRNTAAGCTMAFNQVLLKMICDIPDVDVLAMHDWWIMLMASYYTRAYYID